MTEVEEEALRAAEELLDRLEAKERALDLEERENARLRRDVQELSEALGLAVDRMAALEASRDKTDLKRLEAQDLAKVYKMKVETLSRNLAATRENFSKLLGKHRSAMKEVQELQSSLDVVNQNSEFERICFDMAQIITEQQETLEKLKHEEKHQRRETFHDQKNSERTKSKYKVAVNEGKHSDDESDRVDGEHEQEGESIVDPVEVICGDLWGERVKDFAKRGRASVRKQHQNGEREEAENKINNVSIWTKESVSPPPPPGYATPWTPKMRKRTAEKDWLTN